jgi:hypothetical protein
MASKWRALRTSPSGESKPNSIFVRFAKHSFVFQNLKKFLWRHTAACSVLINFALQLRKRRSMSLHNVARLLPSLLSFSNGKWVRRLSSKPQSPITQGFHFPVPHWFRQCGHILFRLRQIFPSSANIHHWSNDANKKFAEGGLVTRELFKLELLDAVTPQITHI